VAFSMARAQARAGGDGKDEALRALAGFRGEVYRCLTRRGDALFGLGDAVLCQDRPVTDLARLSLVPECGRGYGGVYDGLNAGQVVIGRLRRAVAGLELPSWPDGRIRLAVDVCNWLRPDAVTSPERLYCHVHGRGKNAAQMIPGWPYSFVAVLGPGRSSWTLPLDAVRLGPRDDQAEVTAAQLREVVTRLIEAGHWNPGDLPVLIVMDAGYSPVRLAWLLQDLPVTVVARVRSDRVFYGPAPERAPRTLGRPLRDGSPVRCDDPAAWRTAPLAADAESARHGPLAVAAWPRMHQALQRNCGGWQDWPPHTDFPVIEGTLIRVAITRPAPGGPAPEPMWLWASTPDPGLDPAAVAVLWQAYLRRFDIEGMFRFFKSQLGWDKAMLRDPAAADRWTWIIIACYAQLYLARDLAADIRLPWQRPQPRAAGSPVMTPGRVRAGFRGVRQALGTPASAAKPGTPGPGRPPGSRNKDKAPRHPAGKTTRKPHSSHQKEHRKAKQTRKDERRRLNGKNKALRRLSHDFPGAHVKRFRLNLLCYFSSSSHAVTALCVK
jgi:DDE superfamily endonuclease